MNYTITTTMQEEVYNFLQKEAKETKRTKKSIIEEALKEYQKQQLKKAILDGADERVEEYRGINKQSWQAQSASFKEAAYDI